MTEHFRQPTSKHGENFCIQGWAKEMALSWENWARTFRNWLIRAVHWQVTLPGQNGGENCQPGNISVAQPCSAKKGRQLKTGRVSSWGKITSKTILSLNLYAGYIGCQGRAFTSPPLSLSPLLPILLAWRIAVRGPILHKTLSLSLSLSIKVRCPKNLCRREYNSRVSQNYFVELKHDNIIL